MKLQTFLNTDLRHPLRYNFEAIASDRELAQQIQIRLKALGFLDSAADGNFGPISAMALKNFQEAVGCTEKDFLGAETAKKLIEAKTYEMPKPPLHLGNDLAGKILKYMQQHEYHIFIGKKYFNIIYIEGMNLDGSLNKDRPNEFNDLRLVIEIVDGTPTIVDKWAATTEPGGHYTYYPMNERGAARINFGQYQAWQVGIHGNAEPHEALVQTKIINVSRDFNKDFSRIGDKQESGIIGLNQHWGYDLPLNNVHNSSAGCLVGRSREGHRQFMQIIKQDKRYQANNAYTFTSTILPADQLGI